MSINLDKDYSLTVSRTRNQQDNGLWALQSTVSYGNIVSIGATLTLQNINSGYESKSDEYRKVFWHLIGFYS